ncbi:hypothetical protein A2276_05705 [candidate division WOR-1 bacterium RIFOXYA12_FULL_43_27]|uniref:Outer membrane protein beta-barrel domain-containing protein n=1 Tax=candidate division WOR-1 bacterium RIFOXYC2_FULL_46_14 TaxID=1802587 RepID=A0A1F4U5E5_UNCSA|nr:MAG: hypothetical protein A2276_05705 [candidate division WOR-1 bacterium RIFOXYA12_FULL_43_27]OGC20161.1 MAG: hypothetical protein A2292_03710 [candidate division WOR-1 bacterium RIFOXYB2_FULL_46_45]OGC32102.1 MAG: hypothetical protein A2232_07740 [candidate division WOR-1 bacterium RIFOXYA2_FULL_46_56]OGC39503.1 MAG: hypothetical protein A2438_08100 [candidate division WOR-1 bacterium RIFOXYC2_FULL_46_14]
MKKIVLLLVFVLLCGTMVWADSVADRRDRLNNEIRRLSNILQDTKDKKKKAGLQKSINMYKTELAALPKDDGQAPSVKWLLKGGLSGGAAAIGAGLDFSLSKINMRFDLDYGIGSNYSVLIANLGPVFNFGLNYVNVALDYAGYSKKVELTGAGQVGAGSTFGASLTFGRKFTGNLSAEIGYGTNLGILAGLVYNF